MLILVVFAAVAAENLRGGQLPPEFWLWKTTPPPPPIPGPNPAVVWVEQTLPPLPTTAPPLEACYGCDCLFIDAGDYVVGGAMNNKYTCVGGAATAMTPEFKWAGVPVNSGVGHPILQGNGRPCTKSQAFAVVIEDLDYPYGVGQKGNRVFTNYWAVNIPGDATILNNELVNWKINGEDVVTVGMNDAGTLGLDPPCPEYGVHRIRTTLWALSNTIGNEVDPLDPKQGWPTIRAMLEPIELARTSFYTTVKAPGGVPGQHSLAEKHAARGL